VTPTARQRVAMIVLAGELAACVERSVDALPDGEVLVSATRPLGPGSDMFDVTARLNPAGLETLERNSRTVRFEVNPPTASAQPSEERAA